MPTGKVKWYDAERAFGFITGDDGATEVFLRGSALPSNVTTLKPGARVEYSVVDGRKGPAALAVTVLDPAPSVVRGKRKPAAEMATIVEDLIKVLDGISDGLRHGRYPDQQVGERVAKSLRAVADVLEV